MDELLTIGEFSQACGLSAKVLRTYAADGLLPPAAVDRGSGYRYYTPDQVPRARTIALLRRAGTPLRDIARFLARPTAELLDQWERDLDAEATTRRLALADVRRSFRDHEPPGQPSGWLADQPASPLSAASASEAGIGRAVNQDAVLLGDGVFAVADGLGERGEIASMLAVEVFQASFAAGGRTGDSAAAACRAAGRAVWRRAQDAADPTMGSTLTAVWVSQGDEPSLTVIGVGDSRAYLIAGGAARRLTRDDTLVAGLVRAGVLSEQEARADPRRSLLTRALGPAPDVEPSLTRVRYEPGDRVLLCTDGLSAGLGDQEIAAALAQAHQGSEAVAALLRLARDRGGQDDASAVVVDTPARSAAP
ncbi:MAG TPA: MerR family transcriptional regulator [Streptosporangiaceae bacterium]|nr:MerR family transcriptional regulator [Streptosporangiaceae bacterium]